MILGVSLLMLGLASWLLCGGAWDLVTGLLGWSARPM